MLDFYVFCVVANLCALLTVNVVTRFFPRSETSTDFLHVLAEYVDANEPETVFNPLLLLKLLSWLIPAYTVCTTFVYLWCIWKYPKEICKVVGVLKTYTFGFNALPKGFGYTLFYDLEKKEYVLKYGPGVGLKECS